MNDIPCYRSGMCCKTAPCPFGTRGDNGWCVHLEEEIHDRDVVFYKCGIYDFIQKQPDAHLSPAFGAGCCQSLFNPDRNRNIVYLNESKKSQKLDS